MHELPIGQSRQLLGTLAVSDGADALTMQAAFNGIHRTTSSYYFEKIGILAQSMKSVSPNASSSSGLLVVNKDGIFAFLCADLPPVRG